MRQEWWFVNVWPWHIWTKFLLARVSAGLTRYEIPQLYDRRVKIGSRLHSRHEHTRSCWSKQMSEFYMEIFPEIRMNVFHFHLLIGVSYSCCHAAPCLSLCGDQKIEGKYIWVFQSVLWVWICLEYKFESSSEFYSLK